MDQPLLMIGLLGVLLAGMAWTLFRLGLGSDLVIRRGRGGNVSIRGPLPRSRHAAIREFFCHDLTAVGGFVVLGQRGPGGSWRFRWLGRLSPTDRQRVRNFLLECLK